jgi:plastocyanin domain-containing protein
MNKTALIILSIGLIFIFGFVLFGKGGVEPVSVNNVEVVDGIQYVRITAGGGYFPGVSMAKAGVPTVLVVKTNGSFDCSSALVVRAVSFQEILPRTGETEIDLGVREINETVEGLCSMGMYNFAINFK